MDKVLERYAITAFSSICIRKRVTKILTTVTIAHEQYYCSCALLLYIFMIGLDALTTFKTDLKILETLDKSARLPFFHPLKGRNAYCLDFKVKTC